MRGTSSKELKSRRGCSEVCVCVCAPLRTERFGIQVTGRSGPTHPLLWSTICCAGPAMASAIGPSTHKNVSPSPTDDTSLWADGGKGAAMGAGGRVDGGTMLGYRGDEDEGVRTSQAFHW